MPDFAKYVGIPFVDHGRDATGCDCWGLVRLIYKNEFDIDLPDLGPLYGCTTDKDGMKRVYEDQLVKWSKVKKPQIGDVVLLRIKGLPVHVGVMVDKGVMLHAERGIDSVVERVENSLWRNRVEGFYHYGK